MLNNMRNINIDEINIYLKDDEHISNIIYKTKNFFEYEFLQYCKENHNKQKIIIDIGANIGNHTLYFSEFLKYEKIIAFEIESENFKMLEKNLEGKNCDLYLMGIGEKEEEITLWNCNPHNHGGYSIHYYKDSQYESIKIKDNVKIKTLDSYNFDNISMIKIDVESNELQALIGAVKTINKCKPIIFIENLGHGFNHIPINQFDIFFESIDYIKKEENIKKSYLDLWTPRER